MDWVASYQHPRLTNALQAEALFGYVDHGVAVGFLEKTATVRCARTEK